MLATAASHRHPTAVIFASVYPQHRITSLDVINVCQSLESMSPGGIVAVRYDRQLDVIIVDVREWLTTRALLSCMMLCGMPVFTYEHMR